MGPADPPADGGGGLTLLPLAVLFLPWPSICRSSIRGHAPRRSADEDSCRKTAYLNVAFFLVRAGFYFAIWTVFAVLIGRWSRAQDEITDPAPSRRLQQPERPGLVLLFLTRTFAAIDWGMSLEPNWSSTIYGAMLDDRPGAVHPGADDRGRRLLASDRPMADAATPRGSTTWATSCWPSSCSGPTWPSRSS